MHIGVVGPISTVDIEHLLSCDLASTPRASQGSSLLATLISRYIEDGHRVSAFTLDSSVKRSASRRHPVAIGPNLAVYYLPLRHRAFRWQNGHVGRMGDLFRLEREGLVSAIREARPDVLHAHWQYEYAWAGLDSGLPCLVTCHDAPLKVLKVMPDLYRLGRLFMAAYVLRRARHLSIVSPYLQKEISLFTDRPLPVVPNPVPLPDIEGAHLDRVGRLNSESPKLLMVLNSTHKLKNASRGFEAFKILREKIPGASLEVLGRGYERGGMGEDYAKAAGVGDDVQLTGGVPYKIVIEKMKEADLLLHPSLEESFGMTVAEAMAVGLPVVAGRNAGAIPWLLGDAAGVLVDVRSAPDMADALMGLIKSPNQYRICSAAGQKRATDLFSSRSVASQYVKLYEEILSSI